jgi:hypothetical protein
VLARPFGGDDSLCEVGDGVERRLGRDGCVKSKDAGDNALNLRGRRIKEALALDSTTYIAVDGRYGRAKGDRANSGGGIRTNAGNVLVERLGILGDDAVKIVDDLLRASKKARRPRVVAESAPQPSHVFDVLLRLSRLITEDDRTHGLGQHRDRRVALEPLFVVRDHGCHLRLLAHAAGD